MSGARVIDLADELLRRDVEVVHGHGARPVYEMLVEIGALGFCRTELDEIVRRYARLDPTTLRLLGGDRWPPR
jgi:hypothetical protein